MSDFLIPDPLPDSPAPPLPPSPQDLDIPDEAYGARTASQWLEPGDQLAPHYKNEASRTNATRAEDLNNQYIDRQRDILHTGSDAFFDKTGRDAILGAPDVTARLDAARQAVLDQATTPSQRAYLKDALDAHLIAAHADIGDHVGRQFLAWQRHVIDQRLDHLRTQAGLDYDDPGRIAAYANAGGNAGSSIWRSAIEGALNDGDHKQAIGLYDRAKDGLASDAAAALGPLIDGAREREAGKTYVAGIVPSLPPGLDELEAAHAAATSRNAADWSDNPSQQATNQHFIDVQFGKAKRDAEQATADLDRQVQDWLAQPGADGDPQTERPPLPIWTKLDPTTQKDVDAVLAQNARGVAPNVEPPPGSTEYQAAEAVASPNEKPEPAAVAIPGILSSAAIPSAQGLGGAAIGRAVAAVGQLATDAAAAAPAAAAAALPIFLVPSNSQETTFDLGDGLRAVMRPGQRSMTIERRVEDGVLGTGIGEKWEQLPVDAEVGAGLDGTRAIVVDPSQLKAAIGDEAGDRLLTAAGAIPPSRPNPPPTLPFIEMRIGSSSDAGKTLTQREASREEVSKYCPNFGEYENIALQAAAKARAEGLPNGLAYGRRVHSEAEKEIKQFKSIGEELEQRGIREIQPEIALLNGIPKSYIKGSSRLDVLELHADGKTACIYDFKTGKAVFSPETMRRYIAEAAAYANGYTHIYAVPIHVP